MRAVYEQDVYLLRFLLDNGADPNYCYDETDPAERITPLALDEVLTQQMLMGIDMNGTVRDAKTLATMKKLLLDAGVKRPVPEYEQDLDAQAIERLAESVPLAFDYRMIGNRWAEAYLRVRGQIAQFKLSIVGDDIFNLVMILFIITLSEDLHVNRQWGYEPGDTIDVVFDQEGTSITLGLTRHGSDVDLLLKSSDRKLGVMIQNTCSLDNLVAVVVRAADRIIKKYGNAGYLTNEVLPSMSLDFRSFIYLKAYVLGIADYGVAEVGDIPVSDFYKELDILEMQM
jgi:hypothetical protein